MHHDNIAIQVRHPLGAPDVKIVAKNGCHSLWFCYSPSMMKRNEKIKEAIQLVVLLACSAGIGVLLAWRG
jgi:hypothetical protein